jgi:hypothetical protein
MRIWTSRAFVVAAAVCLSLLVEACGHASQETPYGTSNVVTDPSRAAWILFLQINRNDRLGVTESAWETWASPKALFQPENGGPPVVPPKSPRTWECRQQALEKKMLGVFMEKAEIPPVIPPSICGEIKLNIPLFSYAASNSFWKKEDLIAAAGQKRKMNFPKESIAVKALWHILLEASDIANCEIMFHCHRQPEDGGSTILTYRLEGFHIASRDLPNWFWTTFEWAGNKGLKDPVNFCIPAEECKDTFGFPNRSLRPEADVPSDKLKELFKDYGTNPMWLNYRLSGTQLGFTDNIGTPTRLGNTVIEGNGTPDSSCISCHAAAAWDAQKNHTNPSNLGGEHIIPQGTPELRWFKDIDVDQSLQTSFLWVFVQEVLP